MPHNIEFNKAKGTYSFVSRKEVAWHRLGQVVDQALTSKDAIKLANLDFTVIKTEVYAKFPLIYDNMSYTVKDISGDIHYKDHIPLDCKGAIVPNIFATVRTDTKKILGSVGARYEVVQNIEAFDFIDRIVGNKSAVYETAGALGYGEKIFVTAKLPDYIRINGTDDIIEDYILFTTSHDGSGEITAMLTPIRVVCNNTLSMALSGTKCKVSFKHTKNVRSKLDQANEVMQLHNIYKKDLSEILNTLKQFNVVEKVAHEYINSVFLNASEIELVNLNNGNILSVDEISTKKKNQIIDVRTYLERGIGQDLHRGTALWLFNGVNGYLSNYKNYSDDEKRFESIMNGESFKINQKAYDLITNLNLI